MSLPLELLKKRLVLGVLLLALIDVQTLGFSFDVALPFERQQVYTDTSRQSFLWLHQKLVSVLEPVEVLANVDIAAWYRDNSLLSSQVSPPQPIRQHRPAPLSLDGPAGSGQPQLRVTHSPKYSAIPTRTQRYDGQHSPVREAGVAVGQPTLLGPSHR